MITPQIRKLFEDGQGGLPPKVEWREEEKSYCILVDDRSGPGPKWVRCNAAFHFNKAFESWLRGYEQSARPTKLILTDGQIQTITGAFFSRLQNCSHKAPEFMLTAMREALSTLDDSGHGTEIDRLLWDANGGNHGSDTTTADMGRRLVKERDELKIDLCEAQAATRAVNVVNEDMKGQIISLTAANDDLRLQCGGMEMTINELTADKNAYGKNAVDLRNALDELKERHQALIEENAGLKAKAKAKPVKRHGMRSVMRAIEHASIRVMSSNDCHKLSTALNYIAHDEVLEEGEPLPDETRLSVIEQLKQAQTLNDSLQKLTGQSSVAWHRHETIDDRIHDALEKLGD